MFLDISQSESFEVQIADDFMPVIDIDYYIEQCDKLRKIEKEFNALKIKYDMTTTALAEMDSSIYWNRQNPEYIDSSLTRLLNCDHDNLGSEVFKDVLKQMEISKGKHYPKMIYLENKQTCETILNAFKYVDYGELQDIVDFVKLVDVSIWNNYTDEHNNPIWVNILQDIQDINMMEELFKLGIDISGFARYGQSIIEFIIDGHFFYNSKLNMLKMLASVYDIKSMFNLNDEHQIKTFNEMNNESEEYSEIIGFLLSL